MKPFFPMLCLSLGLAVAGGAATDDWLDEVGEKLSFATAAGVVRAKVGGSLELEGYYASVPVADLVFSDRKWVFEPRLKILGETQLGSRVYGFVQVTADRGFDPADEAMRVRLDEYALRVAVGVPGRLNLQVGKFATVLGNWVARHAAWNNAFITAPLPYENLTGIWDTRPPRSINELLDWSHVQPASTGADVYADKHLRLPVIWGPVYAPGVALSGIWGRFNYAVEGKTASLASAPDDWKILSGAGRRPTIGARLGCRPNEMWEIGLSASEGDYLNEGAIKSVPAGLDSHDYRQRVVAQDVSFAWHRFQFWAEAYTAQFKIPRVADVSTFAYYLEAKYKFTPQFSGAIRWNQQRYSEVRNAAGQTLPWSRDGWRIEVAPAYRFSAHMQLKLQYSLRHEEFSPEKITQAFAVQQVMKF